MIVGNHDLAFARLISEAQARVFVNRGCFWHLAETSALLHFKLVVGHACASIEQRFGRFQHEIYVQHQLCMGAKAIRFDGQGNLATLLWLNI